MNLNNNNQAVANAGQRLILFWFEVAVKVLLLLLLFGLIYWASDWNTDKSLLDVYEAMLEYIISKSLF